MSDEEQRLQIKVNRIIDLRSWNTCGALWVSISDEQNNKEWANLAEIIKVVKFQE